MEVRSAEASDLSTVLNWVTSEHESLIWAGPKVWYPATPESAWSDKAAVRLYHSLGFEVKGKNDSGALAMIRRISLPLGSQHKSRDS